MRYSLIIVDDDAVIRKGLATLVDWAAEGYALMRECSDGKEALSLLAEKPIDVVLTDIRMNAVSGLSVAQYVYENRLSTRVVILSGYQEFAYAREALRYGVMDYLIKPVSIPKLLETFRAIRQTLDRQRGTRARHKTLSNRNAAMSGELAALLYRDAYRRLLRGREALRTRADNAGLRAEDIARPTALVGYDPDAHTQRSLAELCDGPAVDLEPEDREGRALLVGLFDPDGANAAHVRVIKRYDDLFALAGFPASAGPKSVYNDAVIDAALALFTEQYGQRLTRAEVARAVHVNPTYLSRRFKEVTGKNFSDMLAEIRLGHACALLTQTNLSVSAIASKCGYPNAKYFFRAFRQEKGVTPLQWRVRSE